MTGRVNQSLIWAFSLCGLAAIFSSTLSKTPVLPLYASHLGATDAQVGWIAAASTLPGIFMSYFAGAMSDKYGWRRLLFISLFIFATAPFLYLLADSSIELAGVRFYHGFATAILGPVAMAAIVSVSGERKGEMLSLYSSSTMVGRALAPFVGGVLLGMWGFKGIISNGQFQFNCFCFG
ncbi:MAG: MFS transporter [Firmicutes bacterium]|nr:MFS transporter [Bacillota bacterium]